MNNPVPDFAFLTLFLGVMRGQQGHAKVTWRQAVALASRPFLMRLERSPNARQTASLSVSDPSASATKPEQTHPHTKPSDFQCVWRHRGERAAPGRTQQEQLTTWPPQFNHRPANDVAQFTSDQLIPTPAFTRRENELGPAAPSDTRRQRVQPHSHQAAGQGFPASLSPMTSHSQQSSLFNSTNANNSSSNANGPSLSGPKELWIFWYGEEPELSSLVHSNLLKSESEQGSWENVCMSVDVRQHPSVKRVSKQQLVVCQAPSQTVPVILAPYGLAGTLTGVGYRMSDPGTHKILEEWKQFYPVEAALKAPTYDVSTSTSTHGPHSSPHSATNGANNQQQQQQASPGVNQGAPALSSAGIPPVLEVIVGGVRMRYPSCYVLCTELDELPRSLETNSSNTSSNAPVALKTKTSPNKGVKDSETATCPAVKSPGRPQGTLTISRKVDKVEGLLPERVWQETILPSQPLAKIPSSNDQSSTLSSSEQANSANTTNICDTAGQWDFVDPTKKLGCACSKCKRPSGSKGMMSGSQSTKSGTKVKKSTFHKRSVQQLTQIEGWATHWSLTEETINSATNTNQQMVNGPIKTENQGINQQSANRVNAPPGTPVGGPPSYKTAPLGMAGEGPGASPASVAPSPLATPRSQPASVSQPEPTMPTLSPQPCSSEKPPVQTPDNGGPKSVSSLSNQVYSPAVTSFDGAKAEPTDQGNAAGGNAGNNDAPILESSAHVNNASSVTLVSGIPSGRENGLKFLKRPVLPSKEYETLLVEENANQPSETLYDYTSMEAWLNHPVKRMKASEGNSLTSMYSWGWGLRKNSDSIHGSGSEERSHSRKRKADPYEFDDENHQIPLVNLDGFKRNGIKEEEKSPFCQGESGSKGVAGNLFTNEGLQPSFRDLDQIFDNSDTSSDETFQVPTPPGSNKPANLLEDANLPSLTCTGGTKSKSGLNILRPEELSKMFPTPPSQPEHNPIASPCGLQTDNPSLEGLSDPSICIRRTQDGYPVLGSPPDDTMEVRIESNLFLKSGTQQSLRMHYQDWSYVFKPATVYKMLGSSKYSPLSTLPSQKEPPLPLSGSILLYKASWQSPPQSSTAPPATTSAPTQVQIPHPPNPVTPNIPNPLHLRPGLSPISPVPTSIRGTPFDLGSPPSNNMYLKQGPHGPNTHNSMPNHPGHHIYGSRGPEAHALVVNLSLSDSVIGLFRDHNFDSCTMCVCNANNKIIGNIRGSEMGIYVQDTSPEEEAVRCNCGFSASANRRLAHRSGLFYEDEYEITTSSLAPLALPSDEWYERKKQSLLLLDPKYTNAVALSSDRDLTAASNIVDTIPPYLLEMLKEQCILLFGSSTASRFTGEVINNGWSDWQINYLENLDANRAALIALEHGRSIMIEASGRSGYSRLPEDMIPIKNSVNLLHKWQFLWVRGPKSSQDIMNVMKALHPLLQDAVHAKAWDAQYTVSGPLTWRQFHRLAGRGTDDRCEPQPIPSILVGSEKDWLSLSPLAIRFWEKLLLEPYAYPRDVAYIVVCPDSDVIIHRVKTFFREFSSMYEVCQLGKHCPVTKVLQDGIVRVGKTAATRLASEPLDEWFSMLPDIPVASILKLYAKVCKHFLAHKLSTISLDQSLFDASYHNQNSQSRVYSQDRPTPSPKMPPPGTEPGMMPQGPPTPKTEYEAEPPKECQAQENPDDDERDPPALVVYFIEPCGFRSDNDDLHRMVSLGLLRCFASMVNGLPELIKNNITLQVLSLEDILNLGNTTLETRLKNDQMRAMALTVYSQCRRLLVHQNNVKSLTGFGPAAAAELFIKSKDEKKKGSYRLYTPPYILAPTKEKVSEGVEWLNGLQGHTVGGMVSSGLALNAGNPPLPTASSVLYVAYCLSEDQRWLLASATDERGELLETTTISIYVPNRSKRRKASARKHGLQKLMDFILGVMSTGVQPWRLVVGRLGRIGHGELESWSTLLSRKSLLRASNQLKIACHQCSLQYPADTPCVLSACLVSLEPDSCLRLMPDLFTPDERFSASGTTGSLSTPQDVSCTHILVFPTSATTQSSQTAFQEQHINGPDLGDEDLLFINVQEDMSDGIDGMQDLQLGDIFSWADTGPGAPSPVGSPRRDSASQPGSPGGIGASGRQSPFQSGGQGRTGGRGDSGEELGTLLQQPLALGYFVSTAPSGKLPNWFWSSCPQRSIENGAAVFLKSALHLHSHNILHNIDDPLQQQSNAKQHPLDSQFTTDVLRFVLEGYNALSWLCLDPVTHDRKSCLPVHIQKLLQLYYTITTLV
ncbi:Mediator of RNA polymerase II transcription subunit 13 [Orchesella cincta]|uniref:Mediator of RNA polymerase II transcription subunit 13 n=1 Tax=Orchesella cincta TaxID=48709 RepID=A0A1D2NFS0_ORCCI|nr:Mediator of RNA polymerase II transcription subunit 13 [Orchesella cincta]